MHFVLVSMLLVCVMHPSICRSASDYVNIITLNLSPLSSVYTIPCGCPKWRPCSQAVFTGRIGYTGDQHSPWTQVSFLGDRLCYRTVVLSVCLSCLWRWCIVAKRLDGSRCHLVRRWASAQATLC